MVALTILMNTLLQSTSFDPNKNNHYLILGYLVMWIIVIVYVLTLANRQRNVKEEVQLLKQLLSEDEEDGEK